MTGSQSDKRRTALITGASSGIGYELAKQFAKNHRDLVLVARNLQVLHKLADDLANQYSISAWTLSKDLANPTAPSEIFEELEKQSIKVDYLVNNAGFGLQGLFWELDKQSQHDIIQVNVSALTHLTRLFLPGMVQRKSGGILNVASTEAFQPGPLMAVYYASKAYVLSSPKHCQTSCTEPVLQRPSYALARQGPVSRREPDLETLDCSGEE